MSSYMQAAIRQGELSYRELSQLKWLLGSILALISLWTIYDLDESGGLLLYGATLALLSALAKPQWPALFSDNFWKTATPFIIFWVVVDFLLHNPDFMGPLIRMVLLLLMVRSIQYRRKREDLQLVLLCLFAVVISGVLTLSLTFAFQMLLFAPVSMLLLLVLNLAECHEERCEMPPGVFEDFRYRQLLKRLIKVVDARLLAVSASLFVAVGAVAAAIFTLMPRVSLDQALPFMSLSTQQRSGFSDSISYNSVADIQEDNSVAFRVDFSGDTEPPVTPYWRMVVLDEYYVDDRGQDGFRTSQSAKSALVVTDTRIRDNWPYPNKPAARGDWTFYLEGGTTDYLPTLGYAAEIRFQTRQSVIVNNVLRQWRTKDISARTLFFQWGDVIPLDYVPATHEDLNRGRPLETFAAEIQGRYNRPPLNYPQTTLAYPSGPANGDRLTALAQELSGSQSLKAAEYSRRVIEYLTRNHEYSLQMRIPEGQGLPLVRWTFSKEPGYCELFAGAFVLIARAGGYPARVVGGYKGGTLNGFENYYSVRNQDAHAWAEIYDADQQLWLRIDATPGSLLPIGGEENGQADLLGSFMVDNTFQAYLDSLRVLWYRRVVNFDNQSQQNLANDFKDFSQSFAAALKAEINTWLAALRQWLSAPWDAKKWAAVLQWGAIVGLSCGLLWVSTHLLQRCSKNRPDAVRAKAGRLIVSFREGTPDFEQTTEYTIRDWQATYADLQALRFGPVEERPQTRMVFQRARQLLRFRARL